MSRLIFTIAVAMCLMHASDASTNIENSTTTIGADSSLIKRFYNAGYKFTRSGMYDSAQFYLHKSDSIALMYGDDYNHYKANFGIASCMIYQSDYKSAEQIYQSAILMVDQNLAEREEILALAYLGLGLGHYFRQNFDQSIINYQKAKNLREAYFGYSHIETGKAYANLGLTLELLNQFDSSIYYQKKALKIFTDTLGEVHDYPARIYNNLANGYSNIGEHSKAIKMVQRAINIRKELYGSNHLQVVRSMQNLATFYTRSGDIGQATAQYKAVIRIRQQLEGSKRTADFASANRHIAENYAVLGKKDSAMYYVQAAMDIIDNAPERNFGHVIFNYTSLGKIQRDLGEFEDAVVSFEKAIEIASNHEIADTYHLAELNATLGELYYQMGHNEKSMASFEASLNILEYPSIQQYSSPIIALKSILGQVRICIRSNEYDKALSKIKHASNTTEIVRSSLVDYDDVIEINSIWNQINQYGINISYNLFQLRNSPEYLNEIFKYSNKNKGSLIMARQSLAQARSQYQISNDLILSEQQIIRSLNSKRVSLKKSKHQTSDEIIAEINALQMQLDSVHLIFKNDYPSYYNAIVKNKYLEINEYQNGLNENELSIHFDVIDSALYILSISQKDIQIDKKPSPNLSELCSSLSSSISSHSSLSHVENERNLYDLLLGSLQSELNKYPKLIFYPDGTLYNIPMEVLKDKFNSYLFESNQITYGISPDLFLKNRDLKTTYDLNLIALAPEFDDMNAADPIIRDGLSALQGARNEVSQLSSIFTDVMILGEYASEKQFRNIIQNQNTQIIHFATHAVINAELPDESRLLLSSTESEPDPDNDGYLHVYELYGMQMNSEMVTLSACNTGVGQILSGEGVQSLARAFSMAGCPNILMSLWPVSDESTAILMHHFYVNLASGMDKDEALQQAKLSYLQNADDYGKHPYYWAGFVLSGNSNPLTFKRNNSKSYFYLSAVLIILVIIWNAGRKRRSYSLNYSR